MTREERDKVLRETKEAVEEISKLAFDDLMDMSYNDDNVDLVVIKAIRLSRSLTECLEDQVKQMDRIEDRLGEIYEMVDRMNNREVTRNV